MTAALPSVKTVLAEYKRGDEKISVESSRHATRYRYTVSISGGRHDGIQIRCNTIKSVVWLVAEISHALVNNPDWSWLQ